MTDTIGIRRSASRIQVGGVVPAPRDPRRPALERAAPGVPVSVAPSRAAGRRARPARRPPRRSTARARRPIHGNVTIQWPGIGRCDGPRARRDPRRDRRAAGAPRRATGRDRLPATCPGRHPRPEPDERMPRRVALAVEGPTPADGELELDHRLQPVDVGSLQQTGLDQSHGPRRIPSGRLARLRPWSADRELDRRSHADRRARRAAGGDRGRPARRTWPTSSAWSTSTAAATRKAGVNEVGRWTGDFLAALGRDGRVPARPRRRSSATRSSATFEGRPGGAARAADRSPGHRLRPGHRGARGRSGSRTASPTGRASPT